MQVVICQKNGLSIILFVIPGRIRWNVLRIMSVYPIRMNRYGVNVLTKLFRNLLLNWRRGGLLFWMILKLYMKINFSINMWPTYMVPKRLLMLLFECLHLSISRKRRKRNWRRKQYKRMLVNYGCWLYGLKPTKARLILQLLIMR